MIDIKEGLNKFYLGDLEANPKAAVTYINSGEDKIIIDRTFVSDELRGQKVAQQLIKKVIDFARQSNKKIVPQCSFAIKEFEKNREYEDVLFK
jgi:predicted GNAT family acetyltransferase